MSPQRQSTRTSTLVVARAAIRGSVAVKPVHPREIRIREGQTLEVTLAYHIEETSTARETWHIHFSTKLGKQKGREQDFRHEDTPAVTDEIKGTLTETFQPPRGEHVLTFRVEAEYEVGPWNSDMVVQETSVTRGTLRVVVGDVSSGKR